MLKVSHNTFTDVFGKREYQHLDSSIHDGFKLKQSQNCDVNKLFVKLSIDILHGNYMFVNKLYYDQIVSCIMQLNFRDITELLIEIFDTVTAEFHVNMYQHLESEDFIQTFLTEYQSLYDNTSKLQKGLYSLEQNIQNNKYHYVTLIKNYIFYRNVIAQPYIYKGKQICLYELLSNHINHTKNIDIMLKCFLIYQFYIDLSYHIRDNDTREKYFDSYINNKFMFLQKGKTAFLETLVDTINNRILDAQETKNINNIKHAIQFGSYIGDKDKVTFMILYRKKLMERLKLSNINIDLEQELLKFLNYKDDPDTYIKMIYQIQDVQYSSFLTKHYTKIEFSINSDRYKNIKHESINRDICKFTVKRSWPWDLETYPEDQKYNPPLMTEAYLELFEKCYVHRKPDRDISYDYENSTANIELTFGKNTYNIEVALPQLFVLQLLQEHERLSAKKIAELLKISMKKLGRILNSLLLHDILSKTNGSAQDKNLVFYINKSCILKNTNMSIANDYYMFDKQQFSKPVINTQHMAQILALFNDKQNLKTEDILSLVTFPNKETEVPQILEYCLSNNQLILDNFSYKMKELDLNLDNI